MPTWFSLMLEKGDETGLVQEMRQLWGDTATINQAPDVAYVTLDKRYASDHIYLLPGKMYESNVFTYVPENDALAIKWEVLPESAEQGGNADKQVKLEALKGILSGQNSNQVKNRTPK